MIASVLAAVIALSPLAAAVPDPKPQVWRWPMLPTEEPTKPGSVFLSVQVRGPEGWAIVDGLVVIPPESLPVCAPVLPEGAS